MSASAPTATVVMATYHRRALLPRVLDALLADPATTELVVVVDGAHDGSLELLQERAAADPRVVPVWTENRGAAAAQQLGLERARGEVVVMFDDDQIASPGMVSGHVAHHAGHAGIVVVGPVVTPLPARRRAGSFVLESYVRAYERDLERWAADPSTILPTLWGGNVSLRTEDARRVGWFNPGFPYGYNYDHDFGLRCHAAGLDARFDPALRAEHVFTKDVDAFLRDGRVQGRVAVRTAIEHPDIDPQYGTFRPRRALIHLARWRTTYALVHHPLRPLLTLAGAAKAFRAERALGELLWDLETLRGRAEERRALAQSAR